MTKNGRIWNNGIIDYELGEASCDLLTQLYDVKLVEIRLYRCFKRREGTMNYRVILVESDEGVAVSCPALKGCHSQGKTKEEALENIRDAIREWLDCEAAERSLFSVTEAEVIV